MNTLIFLACCIIGAYIGRAIVRALRAVRT